MSTFEAVIISLRSNGLIARTNGQQGIFTLPATTHWGYQEIIAQAALNGTLDKLPPGRYIMAECGDIQMGGCVFELHPDRSVTAITSAKSVNLTTWPPRK